MTDRNENEPMSANPGSRLAPDRDDIASYQRTRQKRGSLAGKLGDVPEVRQPAGSSVATKLTLVVLTLALLAVGGWSALLKKQLDAADRSLTAVEKRVVELESRLSVTDESMEQSSVAMRVKLRELDSEVRKLWDNVWKRSKAQLAEHDAKLVKLDKQIKAAEADLASQKKSMQGDRAEVAKLTKQLESAKTLIADMKSVRQQLASQESVLESANDRAVRVGDDLLKLQKRVTANEEWVESINGFRRQVNRDITALKQQAAGPAAAVP